MITLMTDDVLPAAEYLPLVSPDPSRLAQQLVAQRPARAPI